MDTNIIYEEMRSIYSDKFYEYYCKLVNKDITEENVEFDEWLESLTEVDISFIMFVL
jgi:hypothetical protein